MSDTHKIEVSRRGFLKGAGLTAATTVIESASALALDAKEAIQGDRSVGPDAVPVKLHVNGQEHTVSVEPRYTLAETLRDNLASPERKSSAIADPVRPAPYGSTALRASLHDAGHRCSGQKDHDD